MRRKNIAFAGAVLGSALVLTACDFNVAFDKQDTLTYDVAGKVTVLETHTGSGDVDANGLAGKRVTADTGSGDVDLKFTAVPDRVDVETGSGNGTVWVPSGTYQVTTETGSGDRKIEVDQDVSAPHTVVVKTGSGDVKVLKV